MVRVRVRVRIDVRITIKVTVTAWYRVKPTLVITRLGINAARKSLY